MFADVRSMLGTDVLISPAELAEVAGMHKRTLMKKIDHNELPFARISKRKIVIPTRLLTEQHIEELEAQASYISRTRAAQSVYFIQAESGPVKIGIALDPKQRLAGLQISHFERLTLLAAAPGGIRLETQLHRRFAHLQIRGEWFRFTPEIEAEIARLPKGPRP
jgi:hypothetical protein